MTPSPKRDKAARRGDRQKDLPRRLGRYVLLARLDQGGMTEVYAARLAEEVGPGRLLVIKILPQSSKDDPEAQARFLEEARIVLNLTHGNITAAFEFGREEGRPFLVLEYVPGPSLRQLLDASRRAGSLLAVQDCLFVVREVARALSYAHGYSEQGNGGQGIVHRDISPDNILITAAGQVKLTDFGIAQAMCQGLLGPVWGKAAYIAPEVVAGEQPSKTSDIYSLGAVLFECLTGAPPFRGSSDKETLELVLSSVPRPPSTLRPEIPEELDRYVLRLLSKQPEQRPPDASELEIEIRSLLAKLHFSYTEPVLAETVQRLFSRESFLDPSYGDHIRAGLLRAGVDLSGSETTDELIAVQTVPLDESTRVRGKKKKILRRTAVIAASALLAVAVGAGWLFVSKQDQRAPTRGPGSGTGTKIPEPRLKARIPVQSNEPARLPAVAEGPPPETKADSTGPARSPAGRAVRDKGTRVPVENNRPQKRSQGKRAARQQVENRSADRSQAEDDVEEPPPKTAGESPQAEWGWLNINSYPWSYVSIDGERLDGHTPYRRVKLKGGSHTLVFENPELGLGATRKVDVKPWEEINIGVKLE